MSETAPEQQEDAYPDTGQPVSDQPALDLGDIARNLRAEGMTRSQIARSLAVSTWRVTELLAGEPPRHPGLRARAKDDVHARARQLRAEGKTYDEIAEELGVSKASVSLWTRDLPKPPPRERSAYDFERVSAARRAQWEPFLAEREKERQETKAKAAASVPQLDDQVLLMLGAVLYWAEGTKDKPWGRKESLRLINSDADVIRVFLRWLTSMGVTKDRLTFRVAIHESADVDAATSYWAGVVGVGLDAFAKPTIKKHNPRSVRKNVGNNYQGCLVVGVRDSRREYQVMDGLWHGIVEALSGVV